MTEVPTRCNVSIVAGEVAYFSSDKFNPGMFQLGFEEVASASSFNLTIRNTEDERYSLLLDEHSIQQYNFYTCLFPEGRYELTLMADQPLTITISKILHFQYDSRRSICGDTDDRVQSFSSKCGRLAPAGCTAQLLSNGLLAMSGHCLYQSNTNVYNFSANSIVEFNVPLSGPNTCGTFACTNPSLPQDQYPINILPTMLHEYAWPSTCGRDWCLFQTLPNANTGLTAFEAQGDFYYLTNLAPSTSSDIIITGYGVDSDTPQLSQVQQTHSGENNGLSTLPNGGVMITYEADTRGGNSGSAIQRVGNLDFSYGIHNNGGCVDGACTPELENAGISFQYDNLEEAINDFYGDNTVHVSKVSNSSLESGTAFRPYDTVLEGQVNSTTSSENTVVLMTGTYDEADVLLLQKPMLIISPAGSSTIK